MRFFSSDSRGLSSKGKVKKLQESKGLLAWTELPWIWLLLWGVIALLIRLSYLASKDAWMDEIATILFSLGNSSRLIPLNQVIDLDTVLLPLQIVPGTTVRDVIHHLLSEDNHPPTYFVIAHWWMAIVHHFSHPVNGYASLWAARALPAIFGALAVPATYLLAWISFRQQTTSLICAALMAVSPLSVYVSQEARHYSLAILMVIASLGCFVSAVQALQQQKQIRRWQALAWISINLLSVTVHYFCGLAILAEGMMLTFLLVHQCQEDPKVWRRSHWIGIYSVAAGTLMGVLLWLPVLTNFYGSHQTSFLKTDYKDISDWIDPIVFPFVHVVYAVMSPVTTGYSWQAVAAIVVTSLGMLCYAAWLMLVVVRSLLAQLKGKPAQFGSKQTQLHAHTEGNTYQRSSILAMAGFLLMANLLFLLICYGTGFNIARSHRYSFVYFPSVLILAGAGLSPLWEQTKGRCVRWMGAKPSFRGKAFVAIAVCVGFISSLFVVNNISLKIYNADRFIAIIQQETNYQPIIGTAAFTTEQPIVVGLDIMAIAWEIKRNFDPAFSSGGWNDSPEFLLAESAEGSDTDVKTNLINTIGGLSRPFDLWMMNFGENLETAACDRLTDGIANKGNYSYSHYVCR
ncbi:MAG: phospholipid carrier-dependent glycosyltransferase [Cyanobacteria bacterium P01_D01_bin.1]